MKIYIDHQKVNTRAQLANLASIGGLLLLLASVVISLFISSWAGFSWILMVFGLGIAMVGIYYANRWIRKPRPEDSLDKALKSFDDRYKIYHYPSSLPCDHVLLSPTGLLALEVVNLSGAFYYRKGHWKETMTFGRALRYIVEERVGDPVSFSHEMIQELKRLIEKEFNGEVIVPVKVLTVFTHPSTELEIEGTSIPACKLDKLRKQAVIVSEKLAPEPFEKLSSFLKHLTLGD